MALFIFYLYRYLSEMLGSFNCTFDADDYCGYTDSSPGPSKWIRSREYANGAPGENTLKPFNVMSSLIGSWVIQSQYSALT